MNIKLEPASFQDPEGHIFRVENKNKVYRGPSKSAAIFWKSIKNFSKRAFSIK